jgi:hypothetical protein
MEMDQERTKQRKKEMERGLIDKRNAMRSFLTQRRRTTPSKERREEKFLKTASDSAGGTNEQGKWFNRGRGMNFTSIRIGEKGRAERGIPFGSTQRNEKVKISERN